MARDKTDDLNAYEIYLLQRILVILFSLEEEKRGKSIYERIGKDLGVNGGTIAKFFNDSYNQNTFSFRKKLLDEIIGRLNLEKVSNWDYFKKLYEAPSLKSNPKDYIPYAHLDDLSENRKSQVIADVKTTLTNIFPQIEPSSKNFNVFEEQYISPHRKLKFYLNTVWYIYFIFENQHNYKIGRTVLRIGNSHKKVETEALKIFGANDFKGTVELDENESFLIFNLKTKETRERWVHLKAEINTGTRPGIIIGQYQNIGIGGNSLYFSNVVMEYLPPEKAQIAKPNFFDGRDSSFSEVPNPIKNFLYDVRSNYSKSPPNIYSLNGLKKYIESAEYKRSKKPTHIKLQKEYGAFISHPNRALSNERRQEYNTIFNDLKDFLATQNFKTYVEPIKDFKAEHSSLAPTEFYLNSVQNCDLFVLIYFDCVVSNALVELAWAFQLGKEILILTSKDRILPSCIKKDEKVEITEFEDLQQACTYFKQGFSFYAKLRFPNYIDN